MTAFQFPLSLRKKILNRMVEMGKAKDQIPNPAKMIYGWSKGATSTPKMPTAPLMMNSDSRSRRYLMVEISPDGFWQMRNVIWAEYALLRYG
jgi:hypothetical protein